jgi:hypothetical protein
MSTGFRQRVKDEETAGDRKPAASDDKFFGAVAVDDTSDEEEQHPLVWIPKKLVSEWKNKDGIRCLTLIIQLTGGAANNDNDGVEVKVSNNGEEFAISEVWSPLMSQIDDFYTYFPKAADETDDEFNRRKYAMEDNVQSIVAEGPMKSVYRMSLPFRVDPTVKRVRFLGTNDGCRFAHVDLAERKKLEVEQVIMIDTNRKQLPSSGQKRYYSSL